MDSLPGEDPTLPLAFEGRYGGAAGRGCAQATRLRVAGPGPPAADGGKGTTGQRDSPSGVVLSALSSFPSVSGLQLPDISRGDPQPGPPGGQGKAGPRPEPAHPCPASLLSEPAGKTLKLAAKKPNQPTNQTNNKKRGF